MPIFIFFYWCALSAQCTTRNRLRETSFKQVSKELEISSMLDRKWKDWHHLEKIVVHLLSICAFGFIRSTSCSGHCAPCVGILETIRTSGHLPYTRVKTNPHIVFEWDFIIWRIVPHCLEFLLSIKLSNLTLRAQWQHKGSEYRIACLPWTLSWHNRALSMDLNPWVTCHLDYQGLLDHQSWIPE
jgi:hypothetical protein